MKERKQAEMEVRHFSAKASIADIAAQVEKDWQESARKHAQAYDGLTETH